MIEKNSDEWKMFGSLFKLFEIAQEYDFDNNNWAEKYFHELAEFKKTYKHIPIAKKFALAIEKDNIEHYEKFKAERWKKGE